MENVENGTLTNAVTRLIWTTAATNTSLYGNISTDMENVTKPVQPTAPRYIVYTATVFYIMIFVVGILGNLVVVSVIVLSKSMKTSINVYLINLCVADLLVMIVCMPTALAEIFTMEAWLFGEAMCKLVPFLENTVANASILTILVISIERYRVVKYPLSGIDDDFSKVRIILVAIWTISVLTSLPCISIAVYRGTQLVDGTPIMVCRNTIRLSWHRIYVVTIAIVFFLLPCSTLFVLYCKLCHMLLRAKSIRRPNAISNKIMLSYKDRKRLRGQVINIIGSIVIVFFICHLPLRVAGLWLTFEDKHVIFQMGLEKYLNLLFSTRILFYMNHALNPIVYNLVSTKFRNALKLLYFKKFKRSQYPSVKSSRKNFYAFSNKSGSRRDLIRNNNDQGNIKMNTFPSSMSSSKQDGNEPGDKKNSDMNEQNVDRRSGLQLPETNGKGYEVSLDIQDEKVAVVFRFDNNTPRQNTVVLSTRMKQCPEMVQMKANRHYE